MYICNIKFSFCVYLFRFFAYYISHLMHQNSVDITNGTKKGTMKNMHNKKSNGNKTTPPFSSHLSFFLSCLLYRHLFVEAIVFIAKIINSWHNNTKYISKVYMKQEIGETTQRHRNTHTSANSTSCRP